jgi:hypothetical protein
VGISVRGLVGIRDILFLLACCSFISDAVVVSCIGIKAKFLFLRAIIFYLMRIHV